AGQEVLVGLRDLEQHRIGSHVLDIGFDERSTLLDHLDDLFFPTDGLVDQGVLRRGELAARHLLLDLLLAEDHCCCGRRWGGCREKNKKCGAGGESYARDHNVLLPKVGQERAVLPWFDVRTTLELMKCHKRNRDRPNRRVG